MVKSNIGYFLKKKNMTQRELAKKIGTTEVSISRYVNCDRIPKATTCLKIAEVLECEAADLYKTVDEYDLIIDELEEIHASMIGTDVSSDYFKGFGEAIDLFKHKISRKVNGE